MQRTYLILTILGFMAPSIPVAIESADTGNFLLYANPMATMEGMFANRISTIFMIDLLFVVLVFFIWSYHESRKYGVKRIGVVWALTLLLGLAGGLPLFLYLRERKRALKQVE